LGRPEDISRRREELEEACSRAPFELIVVDPPVPLSRHDDLELAQRRLTDLITDLLRSMSAELVLAPSPHDLHHGHEVVGRATRDAVAAFPSARLWLWGIWSELPLPSLFVPFDEPQLEEILWALDAHQGEIARNDYRDLVAGRGLAARVRGAELVFGSGATGRPSRFAELLTEATVDDEGWWLGSPRIPDFAHPLTVVPKQQPLTWWMDSQSDVARLRDEVALLEALDVERTGAPIDRA
jgi:LmbE family N-acetylglucosaminyl deacetylase